MLLPKHRQDQSFRGSLPEQRDLSRQLIQDDGYCAITSRGQATAETLEEAVKEAYRLTGEVHFENAFYRKDIGKRALAAKEV